jgi:hypothetical protein
MKPTKSQKFQSSLAGVVLQLVANTLFSASLFGLVATFIHPEQRIAAILLGGLLGATAHIICQ